MPDREDSPLRDPQIPVPKVPEPGQTEKQFPVPPTIRYRDSELSSEW